MHFSGNHRFIKQQATTCPYMVTDESGPHRPKLHL